MVSDVDRRAMASVEASNDLARGFPPVEGLPTADPPGEDYATGLPSWRFLSTAMRRGVWVWVTTAVLGLVIGAGLYARHASYQASTSVVVAPNPAELPTDAILTDIALAQSHAVAARALHKLGLQQSAGSFIASYKVTSVTDRVLLITLTAPSSRAAVTRAHAVATAFLQYRAQQFQIQEQRVLTALQQQVYQAKQQVRTLTREISQLATGSASPARQAKLSARRGQLIQAKDQLPALQQAVTSNQVTTRMTATELVQGSQILDAATAISSSRFKHAALYAAGGLVAGLLLGLAVVIVRALVSDRLRRRDDVAHALGIPVRLSVTGVRGRRWRPGRGRLTAAERPGIQRIVGHLRQVLPRQGTRPAALAIVAVDDISVPALSLVSLALSCAREGRSVVLADLCPGTPAARLLGVRHPGISAVNEDGADLVVAVPGDDLPPGPLRPAPGSGRRPDPELARACASASILLTLVQLDPSLGGEHLGSWAPVAVLMVTAGQSTWTKIHAVGELARLGGVQPVSAVLIDADKFDESLGAAHPATSPATGAPRSAPAPSVEADPAPRVTN